MTYETMTDRDFNVDFEVKILHRIENGYEEVTPVVKDEVKWDTEREGSCGKLAFKVYKDSSGLLNFQEGDVAQLLIKTDSKTWKVLFHGYIFTKKRNKDGWIDVIAYDQLRYLKNKATYVFKERTASEIVKKIASDYFLETGVIEDTNYVIGSRVEDDESLFDIIQNALDLTLVHTGKKYVLYDDAGRLCLQNVDSLKTNYVVCETIAEDFDYESSIDDDTYNEIDLYYDDAETNKREFYNVFSKRSIEDWGRLRYTESVQDKTNIQERVKQLLKLHNRKTRTLEIKNAFGDYSCRAGASVIVKMLLGDIEAESYMVVESATHIFKKDQYRMNLNLDIISNEKYNSTDEIYSTASVQLKTVPRSPLAEAFKPTAPITPNVPQQTYNFTLKTKLMRGTPPADGTLHFNIGLKVIGDVNENINLLLSSEKLLKEPYKANFYCPSSITIAIPTEGSPELKFMYELASSDWSPTANTTLLKINQPTSKGKILNQNQTMDLTIGVYYDE